MDAYTSLYTAGGVPALVSTAVTVIYVAIKLITYCLNASTGKTESRQGAVYNSISGHNQGPASRTQSPGQIYSHVPEYHYDTKDNGTGQWPPTTRPIFLHSEWENVCISTTRHDTGDKTMPPLRANAQGHASRGSSYPRDNIRSGSQSSHTNATRIPAQGRRGDDAANQESQRNERIGGEGRNWRPNPNSNDGVQGSSTTGQAGHTSTEYQVSTIGIQTESCDTLYVSKDTLIAYTIAVVQNTQTLQFEQTHVALQTAQNQASIETLLKAEQLMTAHFNLALLTDDIASNTHLDAPAGQTGIPASEPPTSADTEETICKALDTDQRPNRRERAPQPTSAVVPTYRADRGPIKGIPAGYESDNSWDFSDSGEADCSRAPRTTTLLAYTSWRGHPNRRREQNYGRGANISVRGGNAPHSRPWQNQPYGWRTRSQEALRVRAYHKWQ